MRILLVHNYYQEPGGEDRVFAEELEMLQSHGHDVVSFTLHNDSIRSNGAANAARRAFWSGDTYRRVRSLMRDSQTDILHCHNTFPLVSPSVYYAGRAEGVPVVQTLHNYRLQCPSALLYRDGAPCESCLGRVVPWRGVVHRCYRGSSAATAAVGAATVAHRLAGTWTRAVDVYISPSEFARQKFIAGGLPPDKIVVKPNMVHPDPGVGADGGYALFVGRLTPEKGIRTLLAAWPRISTAIPLRIIGDGPCAPEVMAAAAQSSSITWLGRRTPHEVAAQMAGAAVLVFASESYETFGRVVAEAFATGTPVVATSVGIGAELVEHGHTGRLFTAGDPDSLAQQVALLLQDKAGLSEMRRRARAKFEAEFTMARNYEMLQAIYARAKNSKEAVPALADTRAWTTAR